MSPRVAIVIGALLAADGVLLGAFSAHGLREQLQTAGFEAADADERVAMR